MTNLTRAQIAARYNPDGTLTLDAQDLSGLDLSGFNFWRASLVGTNLQGANLEGANLEEANLEGACLERANLKGAILWSANLRGANLKGANVEEVDLHGAKLEPIAGPAGTRAVRFVYEAVRDAQRFCGSELVIVDGSGAS